MQYQNTPLPDLNLSPAQILFHHNFRDYIPSHPSHYDFIKNGQYLHEKGNNVSPSGISSFVNATIQPIMNFRNYQQGLLLSSRTKVAGIHVNGTELVELLTPSQIASIVRGWMAQVELHKEQVISSRIFKI